MATEESSPEPCRRSVGGSPQLHRSSSSLFSIEPVSPSFFSSGDDFSSFTSSISRQSSGGFEAGPTIFGQRLFEAVTYRQLISFIYGISALVRLGLLIYAAWQDISFTVKYTDADYQVFTDAARLVLDSKSPYERHTFRYTPLLAYILIPNIWIHESFGKLAFCILDLIAGYLILMILIGTRRNSPKNCAVFSCLWLFNPFVIAVSTRGNADVIPCILVLLFIHSMGCQRYNAAAVLLGLAVHVKIFPVIFAIPALLVVNPNYLRREVNIAHHRVSNVFTTQHEKITTGAVRRNLRNTAAKTVPSFKQFSQKSFQEGKDADPWQASLFNWISTVLWYLKESLFGLNKEQWFFILLSFGTFLLLNIFFFLMYGMTFLKEALFHHFFRKDHKHNFSVYFYFLYLGFEDEYKTTAIIAFLPQFVSTIGIGLAYCRKRFELSCLLQVFAFVALNKVCTIQYFLWWMALLPFAFNESIFSLSTLIKALCLICFAAAVIPWLYWAYRLEFRGQNVYRELWGCSVLFLASEAALFYGLLN